VDQDIVVKHIGNSNGIPSIRFDNVSTRIFEHPTQILTIENVLKMFPVRTYNVIVMNHDIHDVRRMCTGHNVHVMGISDIYYNVIERTHLVSTSDVELYTALLLQGC
jgi:hypothetical protein